MARCVFCNAEHPEDEFYMYTEHKIRYKGIQRNYICHRCAETKYGAKWYPISGYDENCDIDKYGNVRMLRNDRYYDITINQNANTQYVYLHKKGEIKKRNTWALMKQFIK